jgi:hypothetical protein
MDVYLFNCINYNINLSFINIFNFIDEMQIILNKYEMTIHIATSTSYNFTISKKSIEILFLIFFKH